MSTYKSGAIQIAITLQRAALDRAIPRLTAARDALPEPGDDLENATWDDVGRCAAEVVAVRTEELLG